MVDLATIPDVERDVFIKRVRALYKAVDKYVVGTDLAVETHEIRLSEDELGDYSLDSLLISTRDGKHIAKVIPIGARIVGASGRVDVVGTFDSERLFYFTPSRTKQELVKKMASMDEEVRKTKIYNMTMSISKEGWHYVKDPRFGVYGKLSKDVFFKILHAVSGYGN